MELKGRWAVSNIPWYVSWMTVKHWDRKEIEIGVWPTVKFLSLYYWMKPPAWLQDYQMRDCVNYIPDYVDPTSGKPASGTKIRPVFGYVLVADAGSAVHLKWWRNLKRYEDQRTKS